MCVCSVQHAFSHVWYLRENYTDDRIHDAFFFKEAVLVAILRLGFIAPYWNNIKIDLSIPISDREKKPTKRNVN